MRYLILLLSLAACGDATITTEMPTDTGTNRAIYTSDEAGWTGSGSGSGSGSGGDTDTDDGSGSGDGEMVTWYADCDNDGFGATANTRESVDEPNDSSCPASDDGGWVRNATDCDDSNSSRYPGNAEVDDSVDNDCDGLVDEDASDCYADDDGDGYGNPSVLEDCDDGGVANDDDCDDTDDSVHPGASEMSGGVDANCDGEIDDEDDGSKTVRICMELNYSDEWQLYVNDLDGSNDFWFNDVFLDQDDADGCRTFETGCDHDLEFQGYGEDSPLWGEYLYGECMGNVDAWLVESDDGECATAVVEVDGVEVDDFDNNNGVLRVACDE